MNLLLISFAHLTAVVAVLLLPPVEVVAEEKDSPSVQVMTFNIRYDNPGDGKNRWRNRKEHVAAVVRENNVDIVGMQEVLERQLDDLKQRLPNYSVFGVGRDDGKTKGEYSPIFYSAKRFELLDSGTFWLSQTPHIPGSKSWDAAITRIVSWVQLRDKTAGREFFFFNTHFDHRGSDARLNSAGLLLKKSREIAKTEPIVITGDFNCLIDAAPMKKLTTNFEPKNFALTDAKSICQTAANGPNSTWNGFDAIVPDRRIDFILVSPHFFKVQSHTTREEKFDGRFPSDHLPVQAELQFRPQE